MAGDIFWHGTLDGIFEEIVVDQEPSMIVTVIQIQTMPNADPDIALSKITETVKRCLADITPAFNFYTEATKLEQDETRVKKLSQSLNDILEKCIVRTGLIKGQRKEKSQQNFFNQASGGFPELATSVENKQLAMWLAFSTFERLAESIFKSETSVQHLVAPITPEEADIAHYIGGFVVSKLKRRLNDSIISMLIEKSEPQENTLLAAKSRGRLTNLSSQAKSMFVEMEQVFRDSFPVSTTSVSEQLYITSCCGNEVIQNCFFTATYRTDSTEDKEDLLLKILALYFKVRVHHRCKTIVDNIRRKSKISGKDRALRSKLSN